MSFNLYLTIEKARCLPLSDLPGSRGKCHRSHNGAPRKCWESLQFPGHYVAHSDRTTGDDLGIRAAAPMRAHSLLEPGCGFFHQLTGPGLAVDLEDTDSDAEHLAACVLQIDARKNQVCAARLRPK